MKRLTVSISRLWGAVITQTQVVAAMGTLWALLVVLWLDPEVVNRIRYIQFDQLQRLEPRDSNPAPITVVAVDEKSLHELGQWPWSRATLAELVDTLTAHGASVIGFDMVFSEPDRLALRNILRNQSLSPQLAGQLRALLDNDQRLANALARSPAVTGFILTNSPGTPEGNPRTKVTPAWVGSDPFLYLRSYQHSVQNLAVLEEASLGNGALNFQPSYDGVVRHLPLVYRHQGHLYLPLAIEILRVAQGVGDVTIKSSGASDAERLGVPSGIVQVRVGKTIIPTDSQGRMPLYYTLNPQRTVLSAVDILNGAFDPKAIEGRIVIIGATAVGIFDLRINIRGESIPGVFHHVEAIEQMLHGQFLSRPDWISGAEITITALGGMIVMALSLFGGAIWSALGLLVMLILVGAGTYHAFAAFQIMMDGTNPTLIMAATFLVSVIFAHMRTEQKQKNIQAIFSNYVSPNLAQHLIERPDLIRLGGERRELTMVFTDLTNFTSLSESIRVEKLGPLLNDYFDRMIAVIFKHDGTLDKIVGDALVFMFSAPVTQEDHARRAVACVLELRMVAEAFGREQRARGLEFGETRFGVHTGPVVVGNFGSSDHFEYTALGDGMNIAARLEVLNKQLGTSILISEDTRDALEDEVFSRPVVDVILKGRREALRVYEPSSVAVESWAEYQEFFQALERGDAGIEENIIGLRARWEHDPVIAFHHHRLVEAGESGTLLVMDRK